MKFKVGDSVKVIRKYDRFNNKVSEIFSINLKSKFPIQLDFDFGPLYTEDELVFSNDHLIKSYMGVE